MKIISTRTFVLVGLVVGAFLWVILMSLPTSNAQFRAKSPKVQDGANIVAEVTNLDKQNFRITLSLRITDMDGNLVGGLEQHQFEILEDNQPVEIKKFVSAGQQAVRVCMVIDQSGSMAAAGKLEGAQQASHAFLNLMRDGIDQLGLIVFSDFIREAVRIDVIDDYARGRMRSEIDRLVPAGGTRLYDAMEVALESMVGVSGRRILLVLTDGHDNQRQRQTLERIIKRSQEINVPLFMIGLGNLAEIDEPAMKEFAERTNGQYLRTPDPQQLTNIYRKIGENLQNEYALTYESPNPEHDGMTRYVSVSVRVGKHGTTAYTRYSVGGVLAGGTPRRTGESVPGNERAKMASASPFFSVAVPLLGFFAVLLGAPYFRSMRFKAFDRFFQKSQAQRSGPIPQAAASAVTTGSNSRHSTPSHYQLISADTGLTKSTGTVETPSSKSASAMSNVRSLDNQACPSCGRKYPGSPGERYCLVCDRTF